MGADGSLELLARGGAIGALAVWAIVFAISPGRRPVRAAAGLFCVAVIGFVLNESHTLAVTIGPIGRPLFLLSVAAVGYLWFLVRTLFDDRAVTLATATPIGVLTVSGLAGALGPSTMGAAIWPLHHGLEVIVAAHAVTIVAATWRGDLVESRRRARSVAILAMTAFAIIWSGLDFARTSLGWGRYDLAVAIALAAVAIGAATVFLTANAALMGPAPKSVASSAAPTARDPDADLARRIDAAMSEEEVWRREGLTIAAFADLVAAPEYRVRRVIHDLKGHRNFAAFVNDARIAAAKRLLADPAQPRRTIAEIAFDLGFGSLGPFNRAFREATGKTPSAYRAALQGTGGAPGQKLADS